jgi:putative cardiolipin synthase
MRPARTRTAALLAAALLGAAGNVRADAVHVLEEAGEAAGARVEMIRRAERSIDAMYFIVGDDSVSLAVLTLLRDAERRGVTVRLVVDGHYNAIPDRVQAHLLREGVEIREYHPFRPWRPSWWTRRLHDKLLIVDGTKLITGGRNIESPYYGRGAEVGRRDYVDRDVFVEGQAASDAKAYFDLLWTGPKVKKTDVAEFRKKRLERRCDLLPDERGRERCERLRAMALADLEAGGRLLDSHRALLDADDLLAPASDGGPAAGAREVGEVVFLHDPATGKRGGAGVGLALLDLLDGAQESVVVESPYLVPSRALKRGIRDALARGVDVRVLTNALTATDNLFAQAGYARVKRDVVRWGVDLWEFPGPDCMHAKSAVIDGRLTIIGSFNLDPRSEFLNTEVAVIIDDPATATEVRAVMDARVAQSLRIGPSGAPLPGPVVAPRAGLGKRVKLRLLRLIAPFIHKQL